MTTQKKKEIIILSQDLSKMPFIRKGTRNRGREIIPKMDRVRKERKKVSVIVREKGLTISHK